MGALGKQMKCCVCLELSKAVWEMYLYGLQYLVYLAATIKHILKS